MCVCAWPFLHVFFSRPYVVVPWKDLSRSANALQMALTEPELLLIYPGVIVWSPDVGEGTSKGWSYVVYAARHMACTQSSQGKTDIPPYTANKHGPSASRSCEAGHAKSDPRPVGDLRKAVNGDPDPVAICGPHLPLPSVAPGSKSIAFIPSWRSGATASHRSKEPMFKGLGNWGTLHILKMRCYLSCYSDGVLLLFGVLKRGG